MAVLKDELGRLPAGFERDRVGHVPVVIPRERDHFATCPQPREQFGRRRAGSFVVHQISYDDQLARPIFVDQFCEPHLDRRHPPERHQAPCGPLAQLVAEVQISHRQPPFAFVEKCQTPVQEDVRRNGDSAGGSGGHDFSCDESGSYRLPLPPTTDKQATYATVTNFRKFLLVSAFALLGISCAIQPPTAGSSQARKRISKVRTTAYTHTEAGGRRNAIGTRLSGKNVISAAADWSRWPLGTKFRIVDTDEVFQIDDYGSALIGTGTIDLYKTNRFAMNKWGVRSVDIDILQWGSSAKSLEVLAPRKGNRRVRAMIVALSRNKQITRPF